MRNITLVAIIVVGLGVLYALQRSIDTSMPREGTSDEALFLSSGKTIRRMSVGVEALAADVYWIRTVQYFGRKVIDSGKPISSGATKDIQMDLLAPLLSIVVTLDPQHMSAYRFGAIFLPERDMPAAVDLIETGIRQNPHEWRLYQDLGYIYWQAGNAATGEEQVDNYAKAAYWYETGSNVAEAPWWMHDIAGLMQIKAGSREAARAVYLTYVTSDDQNIRGEAMSRLKQLRSLDEMDAINAILSRYKESGTCPADLRVLASKIRSMNISLNDESMPVDPDGFAYAYDPEGCRVELSQRSTVPR